MVQEIAVRVASLRDPALGFTFGDVPQEVNAQHYDHLPAVEFEVRPDVTLGEVVDRGIQGLGFPEPHDVSYVEFRDADAVNGRTNYTGSVVLVDAQGRAVWGNYWRDVRLEDAIRSFEAGAFSGNPRRPVVVPYVGFGNGVGIDWSQVLLALGLLWNGIGHITTVYGAVELGQRLSRVFRRRQEVTERHYRAWQERHALPGEFIDFMRSRPSWDAHQLGSLLGCPAEHAEAILIGHGFAWDNSQRLWTNRVPPGHDARLIRSLDELILWVEDANPEDQKTFNRYAQQIVAEFLEKGEAPRPIDLYWQNQQEAD